MVASTDLKARLFDLFAEVMERVREGNRDGEEVANILQAIKEDKKFRFAGKTAEVVSTDARTQLAAWESRYLSIGIKKNFSKLRIPDRPDGFSRLIVVVKELRISDLITELKKKMNFWTYTDLKNLDKVKDIVQRPDGDYAIWVRDSQEADEELKNKSADDIRNEGLNTETLKERILHEWAYNEETDKHLDVKNYTLCSGSRYTDADGDVRVPCVDWDADYGEVGVYWWDHGYRFDNLRARIAVS